MNTTFKTIFVSFVALFGLVFGATTTSAQSVSCTSQTVIGYIQGTGGLPVNVWFEWGTDSNAVSSGNGSQTPHLAYGASTAYNTQVNQTLSNLNPSTTYYYRFHVENSVGPANGPVRSFTTMSCGNNGGGNYYSQPTITTMSASNVTTSSGTMNGSVNGNGNTAYAWFEWGSTPSYGNSTGQNNYGAAYSSMSNTISGLNPNTTYYYRAVAQNQYGTVYGNQFTFTTSNGYYNNSSAPTVSTSNASNLSNTAANLNGSVNGNGYYTTEWFEWGTTPNYGNSTTRMNYGSGYTPYTIYLQNLSPNTTYYFRAVAQNQYGTSYGNQMSFVTSGSGYYGGSNTSAPSAVTTLATQIADSSAQLNSLVFTSNSVNTNAWFEWGTTTALGYKTSVTNVGNLPSVRHADTIYGLVRGTTYYYKVVAENSYGRGEGAIMSFVAGQAPDTTVVIGNNTNTVRTTTVVRGVGSQSLVTLSVDGGSDTILPGESRSYHVSWKNVSGQTLKNVALRVTLPQSMTFVNADKGSFSSADNTLSYNIKDLSVGETGDLSLMATASRNLKNGELVVIVANMVYTDASGIQGDALAYVNHTAGVAVGNDLGASVFGAGSFLPTTLFGWLLLIILILLLVLIGNHLYGRLGGTAPAKH